MNELAETGVIRITQYEALQSEIAIAKQDASKAVFQYRDPRGNKLARSHVHALRLLKGKVESARKTAKAYALEYGRKVDSLAKDLSEQVEGLILPHEIELKKIEDEEKARVSAHKAVIQVFADAMVKEYATSAEAMAKGQEVKATAIDNLEEFVEEAEKKKEEALAFLRLAYEKLKKAEDDAAELARLRSEAEKRAREEREKRLMEEAAAKAKAEAEAKAAKEAAAREAQIKAERERAARKEAQAKAREEVAIAAAKEAEQAVKIAEERAKIAEEKAKAEAKAAQEREAKRKQEEEEKAARIKEAEEKARLEWQNKRLLNIGKIADFIREKTAEEIAEAFVDGILDDLLES